MTNVYVTAFIMGVMGGVHCMSMCGGIVGVLSANLTDSVRANPQKLALYQLSYNMGRIITYILLGGVFAGFSYVFMSSIMVSEITVWLRIFAGILIILIGLFIAGITNIIIIFETMGRRLWQYLSKFSEHFLPIANLKQALLFGIFWGGIPCGLVYSALALTLTAHPMEGMLIMAFFGLGTLPTLLAMAGFGFSLVRLLHTAYIKQIAGITIVLLGVWSVYMSIQHLSGNHLHTLHFH